MQNKRTSEKGFTLIEVLLIIFLVSMLGVAALTSFMDSSDAFTFLDNHKKVMSVFRTGRSYAITNKDSKTVPRYGIQITANSVNLFEDDEATSFIYSGDENIRTVTLPADYAITSLNNTIGLPIYLYYETGNGNLTVFNTSLTDEIVLLPKDEFRYIPLKLAVNNELERFIYIIQVSGMVEESVQAL